MGVPLKFYFGNERYDPLHVNFFNYQEAKALVDKLKEEYTNLQESAEAIYSAMKGDDEKLFVSKMLSGLDENSRDVIEE